MKDPYAVLGVPSTASADEVKRAYRELAKKYHPDNYINNPLSDLAEEKMKEINEAYDAIINSRSSSNSSSSSSGGYSGSYYQGGNSKYQNIRRAIAENNILLAEQLLSQATVRDAEWHFLMGSVMLRKGWYDNARTYFEKAYSMEPNNREYAEALNRMRYTGNSGNFSGGMITPCDCCTGLMCADCLCDCC